MQISVAIMDQTTIISHWEDRARRAGHTVGQLCRAAGVAPSTFSRWKAGTSILFATANKIEAALLEIEARQPAVVGVGVVHSPTDTQEAETAQDGKSTGVTAQDIGVTV
jgi:hypothetical protein